MWKCKPQYEGLASIQTLTTPFSFLPQLLLLATPNVLKQFATSLYEKRSHRSFCPTPEAVELLHHTIRELLSSAIDKVDFYAEVRTAHSASPYGYGWPHSATQTNLDPSIAFRYLEVCLATGRDELVARIIDKLMGATNQRRIRNVLLPLITRTVPLMQARHQTSNLHCIRRLGEFAVANLLDGAPPQSTYSSWLNGELETILNIAVLVGGHGLLSDMYVNPLDVKSSWLTGFV